jgi:surface protein
MNHMFYGCSSLEELDLRSLNTDKVVNMNDMFYKCLSLKKNKYFQFYNWRGH